MATHIDDTFAACAAFSYEVAPSFQTRIEPRRNGYESRNAERENVWHEVSIPFQNISKADVLDIKRLFLVCRGNLRTFRVRDWADYEAENEIFGVGGSGETDFQLRKISEAGGETYERLVLLPGADTVITVNGAPAGSHTIDRLTGIVSFAIAPAPGAILRWSGAFDLKVRFTADRLPFTIDNKSRGQFRMNGSIDLLEVPE
jgi:uncharacterized protein (TIGR02217 family)